MSSIISMMSKNATLKKSITEKDIENEYEYVHHLTEKFIHTVTIRKRIHLIQSMFSHFIERPYLIYHIPVFRDLLREKINETLLYQKRYAEYATALIFCKDDKMIQEKYNTEYLATQDMDIQEKLSVHADFCDLYNQIVALLLIINLIDIKKKI